MAEKSVSTTQKRARAAIEKCAKGDELFFFVVLL